MFGAIIGDIAGSRFEFDNYRSKEFSLFGNDGIARLECGYTDDSVMTVAVAEALLDRTQGESDDDFKRRLVERMHYHGIKRPDSGYGGYFYKWLFRGKTEPYGSFGNGSAMRVAPAGWVSESLEETEHIAKLTAEVTHNHPEGIKGAQATAAAVWMARKGKTKEEIKEYISDKYYPDAFYRTLDEIRPVYRFDETCQGTVPEALIAFFESESFEDAVKCAVSLGGDSDTLAAITGAVAESYYGIPFDIINRAVSFLDEEMKQIALKFYLKYQISMINLSSEEFRVKYMTKTFAEIFHVEAELYENTDLSELRFGVRTNSAVRRGLPDYERNLGGLLKLAPENLLDLPNFSVLNWIEVTSKLEEYVGKHILVRDYAALSDIDCILKWNRDIEYVGTRSNPYFGLVDLRDGNVNEKCEVIYDFGCSEEAFLYIPKNVKKIYPSVSLLPFLAEISSESDCYCLVDNCLIEKYTKTLNGAVGTDFKIPDDGSVVIIGDNAFFGSYYSGDMILPETIEEIGDYSFAFCDMHSVRIPESIRKIGKYAFEEAQNLEVIYWPEKKKELIPQDVWLTSAEIIEY